MRKWEYTTTIWFAHTDNSGAKEYIEQRWPGWDAPKCAPASLVPILNQYGERGWELIQMQPVLLGEDWEILYPVGGVTVAGGTLKSNAYLCVFKRPRDD